MSIQITIDLPETAFSALRESPVEFAQEMRLAVAVKWYQLQRVSQVKVAELAGVSGRRFWRHCRVLRFHRLR